MWAVSLFSSGLDENFSTSSSAVATETIYDMPVYGLYYNWCEAIMGPIR